MTQHPGHAAQSDQGNLKRFPHPLSYLGFLWIVVGCAINEWTIRNVLEIDVLGPISRYIIYMWNGASISWGIATILLPHKDLIKSTNLLLLTIIFLATTAEYILHSFPTVLGHDFANGVLTKYTTRPDGIYYTDPALKMQFMLPNYSTEMYFYGYKWLHETDSFGFRNPVTRRQADIMLLGDSLIYGHGVEINQTVGHFVEELTGKAVVNLGQQADTCFQEAYKLATYIHQFRPWYVLYFYYTNDIRDLYAYLTDEELNRFIDTPLDAIAHPKRTDIDAAIKRRADIHDRERQSGSGFNRLKERMYLLKVVDWIGFYRHQREIDAKYADQLHDINNEDSLGWRYMKKCIAYMNHISQAHHAQFVMVPITPDNKGHRHILQKFARGHRISFVETEAIDSSNKSLFLPRDGHFNEDGAKTVARLVVEHLAHLNPEEYTGH